MTAILGGMLGTAIGGPIGGFLGGLAFGIAGGLAADKITRWLMGEEVETKDTGKPMASRQGAYTKSESQQLETKIAKFKGVMKMEEGSRTFKRNAGGLNKEQMGTMVEKWEADLVRVKAEEAAATERIEHGDVGTSMGLGKVLPAPAIQDTFDLDVPQGETFQGVGAARQAAEDQGLTNYQIKPVMDEFDEPSGEYTLENNADKIQPNINQLGAAVHQAGANGGVLAATTVVNQTTSITNADQQTVSSTSSTSNVISFDTAQGRQTMRKRFA